MTEESRAKVAIGASQIVEISGEDASIREVMSLIGEALQAREHRRTVLAGGKLGYYVVFYSPERGMGSLHIEMTQPLDSFEKLMQIQLGISRDLQTPACIISWCELDKGSRILAPPPGPMIVPANA